MKKRIALPWIAPFLAAIVFCACSKTGGRDEAVKLAVSDPPVTPEQIAEDVIDQEDPFQSLENWKNYNGKVVAWSGTVGEADSIEKAQAARYFAYSGRTLAVIEVKSLRVQVPSDKPFAAGTNVAFTASLNGYSASGDDRKVYVAADGLSINAVGKR